MLQPRHVIWNQSEHIFILHSNHDPFQTTQPTLEGSESQDTLLLVLVPSQHFQVHSAMMMIE